VYLVLFTFSRRISIPNKNKLTITQIRNVLTVYEDKVHLKAPSPAIPNASELRNKTALQTTPLADGSICQL
jgi:hypothetical protein